MTRGGHDVATIPVALTIAGSDSGAGAGIQADLKAIASFGVYGTSVITAVTAQNTVAVTAVAELEPGVVAAQMRAVFGDFQVRAIKIGMLSSPEIIRTVARELAGSTAPVVLDPVMVAKSGNALLRDEAVSALVEELIPLATVLTPNLPEAARLLGTSTAMTMDGMREQGEALLDLGPSAVLMKGGHAPGAKCRDILVTRDDGPRVFSASRIATRNTHGTGCTLSAAIAAGLAKGRALPEATAERMPTSTVPSMRRTGSTLGPDTDPFINFYWTSGHDG